MARLDKNILLKIITEYYLHSPDFNGIPIRTLLESFEQKWSVFKSTSKGLIEDELIGLIDPDTDINPSIIRVGFETIDKQIAKLNSDIPPQGCFYPTKKHLNAVITRKDYDGRPYKLSLALGEAKLAHRSFDLSILEHYRNDPRFSYENDDIKGKIINNTDEMKDSDKVFLKTFGFSYDEKYNRAVAVFLCYLADLTPEHQQMWKAKELDGNFELHPGYYRTTILGHWGEKVPICSALLKELNIINKMSKAMGRPPLFNDDYYGENGENKPKRFGFLIRPTLEEFNNFILLFDKMLSENINKNFFQNEVSYDNEIVQHDGSVQVQQKGTLQILDDWVHSFFETNDWEPWNKSILVLRKIRKMRQNPAHRVHDDEFDQQYFKEQRNIIIDAYVAMKTIRLMFACHPRVTSAKIEIPDWLQECRIWTK